MSIYLVRPGETDFDAQNRIQGALNLPLNQAGNRQIGGLVDDLRDCDLEMIYTSPTDPALTTARHLADQLDVPLKVLRDLENIDLGLWQGMAFSEIRQKQPRVFRQFEDVPESVCPPQGEPCAAAMLRVARALKKPLRRKGSVAIVACEPIAAFITSSLTGERPKLLPAAHGGKPVAKLQRFEELQMAGAGVGSWARQDFTES